MHITIDISKEATKRLLILGVTFSGLVAAAVYAALPYPNLADGSVLTAAQLNGNFGDLNARLAAVETTVSTLAPKTAVPTVTAWQTYTPVLSRDGGAIVGNQTTTGVWRRVGDSLEVNLVTNFTAAPMSGATWYQWSLPTGLTIDFSRTVGGGVGAGEVGGGLVGQGIGNNIALATYVRSTSGVSATANGAGVYYVDDTEPIAFDNGGSIALYFTVPIVGWTATN